MNRKSPIILTVTVAVSFILLLGYLSPGFQAWILSGSQSLPQPFLGNVVATEIFLGLVIGVLGSLPFRNMSATARIRVRRTRPVIPRRQSLVSPTPHSTARPVNKSPNNSLGNWKPLPPMLSYFGGKSRLAPRIIKRIPKHQTWVEPFAGGASVTLAKPPSSKEVLADKRQDLLRFYRHVKAGKTLNVPPHNKAVFDRIHGKREVDRTPGELVRLQGSSYGSNGEAFAVKTHASNGELLSRRLPIYADRLANVTLIDSDYHSTIKRYDSSKTLFYLDPPYPRDKISYADYGRKIPTVQDVKSTVDHVHGKVMISYPNLPSVRQAFKPPHWHTEQLRTLNSMYGATGSSKTRTELLITNYNPARDRWKPESVLG